MEFIEYFHKKLSSHIDIDILAKLVDSNLWRSNPELAASIFLSKSECFDVNDYLIRNSDVASSCLDPIYHYVKYGIWEGRTFSNPLDVIKQNRLRLGISQKENQPDYKYRISYSVVLLPGFKEDDILRLYEEMIDSKYPPEDIIYFTTGEDTIVNIDKFKYVNRLRHIHIVNKRTQDIILAALSLKGDFVSILTPGCTPDPMWINNATRVTRQYNAICCGSGYIVSKSLPVLVSRITFDYLPNQISCEYTDIFCDFGIDCLFLKRKWLTHCLEDVTTGQNINMIAFICLTLYTQKGIQTVAAMQPENSDYGVDSSAIHNFLLEAVFIKNIEICRNRMLKYRI